MINAHVEQGTLNSIRVICSCSRRLEGADPPPGRMSCVNNARGNRMACRVRVEGYECMALGIHSVSEGARGR